MRWHVTRHAGHFGIVERAHTYFVVRADEPEGGADASYVVGEGRACLNECEKPSGKNMPSYS